MSHTGYPLPGRSSSIMYWRVIASTDSADVDLDAILGELCALGDELDNESRRVSSSSYSSTSTLQPSQSASNHSRNAKFVQPSKGILQSAKSCSFEMPPSASNGIMSNQKSVSPLDNFAIDLVEHYYQQTVSASAESPDNDSAFSDNVSCISSESGASRNDGVSCMSSGSSSKSSNGSLNAPSPTQVCSFSRTLIWAFEMDGMMRHSRDQIIFAPVDLFYTFFNHNKATLLFPLESLSFQPVHARMTDFWIGCYWPV